MVAPSRDNFLKLGKSGKSRKQAMAALPPVPGQFKAIQHYLKTALEHDKRDEVVSYYCKY